MSKEIPLYSTVEIYDILKSQFNVSRETLNKLELYVDELIKWNSKINLIGQNTLHNIWQRHILDSAQTINYIPSNKQTILDIGSGAGLPSAIISILTDHEIHLIESDTRKCAFLNNINIKLNLKMHIHNERIEDVSAFKTDIITSRAFAPLDAILKFSQLFLEKNNFCLFLKGQNIVEEIKEAKKNWSFDYELFDSISDSRGKVLKLRYINECTK